MHRTEYTLRPKSGAWSPHPIWSAPEGWHLVRFNLTVQYEGKQLGGTNIQAVLGASDQPRRGLDEEVALWLDSGWWVTFRNQFALAPCVATEVLDSIAESLSSITAEATAARGAEADALTKRLFATTFTGEGPAYWR